MLEKVAVVKVNNELYEALDRAIDLIGGFGVKDGQRIVIKPNLSDLIDSEEGVTTSPHLVDQLVRYIKKKADVEISIVESDHWVATADEEFDMLGYNEIGEKYGVRLVNISHDKKITTMIDGFHLKSINVPEIILKCDKFISVAKLKTHSAEKITCILKNQFGLITKRYKSEYHPYMSKVLTDLNRFYKPDLCIVDGIVALEGSGPTFGEPKKTGLIICGRDPVAVDFVAADIMGFSPYSVPHLKFASNHDVGKVHKLDDIEIVGERLSDVKMNFKFVPFLNYSLTRIHFACIRYTKFLSGILVGFTRLFMLLSNIRRDNLRKALSFAYKAVWTKVAKFLTRIRYSTAP